MIKIKIKYFQKKGKKRGSFSFTPLTTQQKSPEIFFLAKGGKKSRESRYRSFRSPLATTLP